MSELNTAHGTPSEDEPEDRRGTEREEFGREIMGEVERHTDRLNLLPGGGAFRIVIDQAAREIIRGMLGGPGYTRPDREAHEAALQQQEDRNLVPAEPVIEEAEDGA